MPPSVPNLKSTTYVHLQIHRRQPPAQREVARLPHPRRHAQVSPAQGWRRRCGGRESRPAAGEAATSRVGCSAARSSASCGALPSASPSTPSPPSPSRPPLSSPSVCDLQVDKGL
ncbi:unnamed protein product [Urochloa humidicola]